MQWQERKQCDQVVDMSACAQAPRASVLAVGKWAIGNNKSNTQGLGGGSHPTVQQGRPPTPAFSGGNRNTRKPKQEAEWSGS